MKKLFSVIRQGKFDEVKTIIEKKPEFQKQKVTCLIGITMHFHHIKRGGIL
ncbi:MAG: hypothetical protein KH366_25740 [Clostridiaceae bacterium]|nr:hypothetical protein [Clostridiaceae bacterium]